jgi:hypothetical protein
MVPNPSSGNGLDDCAWATQIASDTTPTIIQIRALCVAFRKYVRLRLRTGQLGLIGFAPSEFSNACAKPGVVEVAGNVRPRIALI